ncbi:LysE family translocator [Vitreoscilla massiliensis]|uniref:LysE family translocator n=1 Tax=Vitreoscilla massiliensis TaxID=1689272 RepID=A0ABY4E990_9NEIS|nr:LysE family translocator [Vitreoscilla massiliensis]UOO89982.1 LysE family translocator [Vitreoscilla massiliensis]
MEWGVIAAFWGVSMLFIMSPGADWSYAISAGIHKRVVPSVTGLLCGHVLATLVVAAGVGLVLAEHPQALLVLTVLGALYLAWMGWQLFRQPAAPSVGSAVDNSHWHSWCWKGLCISGLNPKVLLLFMALLPQFIAPTAAWGMSTQILALGLVHIISCAAVYFCVGFSSQAVLSARPQAAWVVGKVSGVMMMAIALLILWEQYTHM